MGRPQTYGEYITPLYNKWATILSIQHPTASALFKIAQTKHYELTRQLCKPPWFTMQRGLKSCRRIICPFCWGKNILHTVAGLSEVSDRQTALLELRPTAPESYTPKQLKEVLRRKNLHTLAYAVSVAQSKVLEVRISALCCSDHKITIGCAEQTPDYVMLGIPSISEGIKAWLDTLYPPFLNEHVYAQSVEQMPDLSPWMRLGNLKSGI